jgi:polyhydroxyalkanoate synthesis regulator phasin
MNPFGSIVQKAFYLGMGLASVAGEKAGATLNELRSQAAKLAEDLVERGEMSTEEARKFVDDLVGQSQNPKDGIHAESDRSSPRTIDILNEDEDSSTEAEAVERMRAKVQNLQEELNRMKNK